MAASFAPFRSFVDATFFSELSRHKLEHAKLSEAAVPLNAVVAPGTAPARPAAIHLSAESMRADAAIPVAKQAAIMPGKLINQNTIEGFRDVDKLALVRDEARSVAAQIRSGEALERPELLLHFTLLTFADLKKYKFYYWFMFPALSWTSAVSDSHAQPSAELDKLIAAQTHGPVFVISESSGEYALEHLSRLSAQTMRLGIIDFATTDGTLPWHLRNTAAVLASKGVREAEIYIFRPLIGTGRWVHVDVGDFGPEEWDGAGAVGWERNAQNKLVPKLTDLSSLMNPLDLADQAVDLNLKLMKWRAAPQIDLGAVAKQKCLLLGAGTLGSYVARGLLAWGIRHVTFVDSGRVSYSNPVRQPLYTHEDCVVNAPKAETAAKALRAVFPGCTASGYQLEIPMAGHPITSEQHQHTEYEHLVELVKEHDVVFLLMDSRESRWLPTVLCQALGKLVINVALGFDSYLVMRHGVPNTKHAPLGCYYCNDVVAPVDSVSRLALDQMCTVTRPGVAMLASGYAVELLAQVLQHEDGAAAPAGAETALGPVPHQLRGFLKNHETMSIWGPAFTSCSACGPSVLEAWRADGWEFVKRALNDSEYVTEISGLGDLQRQTAELDIDSASSEAELE